MSVKDIPSIEIIEELQEIIRKSKLKEAGKEVDLTKVYSGILNISLRYGQRIYEELKREGIPVDEIEGTGKEPGLGHVILATALITTTWSSWLFPDKGLNRFNNEISRRYSTIIGEGIQSAIEVGSSHIKKNEK